MEILFTKIDKKNNYEVFNSFIEHTQLKFLVSVFSGTALSIVTLAKVLEFFFTRNEQLVWSYRN